MDIPVIEKKINKYAAYQKKYYNDHKDYYKNYYKTRHLANKDKHNEYNKKYVKSWAIKKKMCNICNKMVSNGNSQHKYSKSHIRNQQINIKCDII